MEKIAVSLIAHKGAPEKTFNEGKQFIEKLFLGENIEFTKENTDVLFVLTGGSENEAKQLVQKDKALLIIANPYNNSYAAATEIKAYCNDLGATSILINTEQKDFEVTVKAYIKAITALRSLEGLKLGLLGQVSDWLIISEIEKNILDEKFGILLKNISWSDYQSFENQQINKEFLNHFQERSAIDLNSASKVYNLLKQIIEVEKLDAITVECFPLVQEKAVTACLALSKFNTDGFIAGCEGDIVSVTGMMVGKALLNQIPWMANLIAINDASALFAHCTIATNLVEKFNIDTHFETDKGSAVAGNYKSKEITIFRLNNKLNRAFTAEAEVIDTPFRQNACRTQIEVKLSEEKLKALQSNPLGNHHLIFEGNQKHILEMFCKLKDIQIV